VRSVQTNRRPAPTNPKIGRFAVDSLAVRDWRGARGIFAANRGHSSRELPEKISGWDPVVTGVVICGDSKHMEDGVQLIKRVPAMAIAASRDVYHHPEREVSVSAR